MNTRRTILISLMGSLVVAVMILFIHHLPSSEPPEPSSLQQTTSSKGVVTALQRAGYEKVKSEFNGSFTTQYWQPRAKEVRPVVAIEDQKEKDTFTIRGIEGPLGEGFDRWRSLRCEFSPNSPYAIDPAFAMGAYGRVRAHLPASNFLAEVPGNPGVYRLAAVPFGCYVQEK